jgi:hypothetical protein
MPVAEKDLYDEWASGVSLANNPSSNFFEEIPTELANPASFTVASEQLPVDPTQTPVPVQIDPTLSDDGPEEIALEGGGTILIEKTSKGWKAILDSGENNIPAENFYGENKTKLIANLAKGKLEASRVIRKLKKEKMLGGEEVTHVSAPPAPRNTASIKTLSADDVYEIKNKLADNPADAIDIWVQKRFGLNPDEFAEALKSAPEAKRIVDAKKIQEEIDEISRDFVGQNPDYVETTSTADPEVNRTNIRLLVGRMAKAFLNKKVTKNSAQTIVDDVIYELYSKGFWTVDNLETAKEELVENGLFERPAPTRGSQPQPQPVVAPSDPSAPAAPRIAAAPGQPVGLVGLPARSSTPVATSDPKPLTDVDLQKLPLDQLRAIAQAQLMAMRHGQQ